MGEFVKTPEPQRSIGITSAVQQGLAWLVFGNSIGVMIATLLLLPQLNPLLGEWTYGRWMMVHMNTALFGWCSVPILALLFRVYDADRGTSAAWCRPAVWLWSAALLIGSYSWLQGHSSGKLFLDWVGYSRVFFPMAMFGLWALLAFAFVKNRKPESSAAAQMARSAGLLILLLVPVAIFFASSPNNYPAVNPQTGGPTGGSQLESTLGIVLLLLALPLGIVPRRPGLRRIAIVAWSIFALEGLLSVLLGDADVSHHVRSQYLSLASVLVWIVLIPAYYDRFEWNPATRPWRSAFLAWWVGLVISGYLMFLPGVLDRLKFTDALVGHSLLAVAGFLSAYILFILVQLIGERDAWILNRKWSFHAWNLGVLAYVLVMFIAGWVESADPAFTVVPGMGRNILYVIRWITGVSMLAASIEWLVASLSITAEKSLPQLETPEVKVA